MKKKDRKDGKPGTVVDIKGKLKDYVTLDEFMKRTAYIEEGGEVFEIDEDLLNGEPCQLSESDIEHLPKLDIDWYLNNGYITAEDYRKQLNHFDG